MTTRLLRALGHRPIPFAEPRGALEWLASTTEPVECLLTDQTMPGLTGDQLVEAARALRPGLPSLIITGFSHVLTPARIVEVGVSAVLHKPVDRHDLAEAIAHAVSGSTPLMAD